MNYCFIEVVCCYLGIQMVIIYLWDYMMVDGKIECFVDFCVQVGVIEYILGFVVKDYVDEMIFLDLGIWFIWFDYVGYLEYL